MKQRWLLSEISELVKTMKELLVTIALIFALGAMILPLPTFALDIFLIGNLLFSFSLLVISLYLQSILKLSSLPTLLLMTTLFRVSLGVATTRSILSHGEAGHAVSAFGSLVMQGSLVIGFVVFLIITLVQFLVIAKGAERVAEVGARFSLDAMPGRQMSIDADVRSGVIDGETARKKRSELQTESRFYGALDGAMKFIKGDAIAGMVIVGINVIGGLILGMSVHQLSLSESAHHYTMLSIGEGLLSQIPALLNALAAGMVITRVSSEDKGSLASDLITQLGQFNNVKAVAAVGALLLALVPGMPSLILVTVSCGLFGGAMFTSITEKQKREAPVLHFIPKVTPLLEVLIPRHVKEFDVYKVMEEVRQDFFNAWGVLILPVPMSFHAENTLNVRLRGLTVITVESSSVDTLKEKTLSFLNRAPEEMVDDVTLQRLIDFVSSHAPERILKAHAEDVPIQKITKVAKLLLSERISIKEIDLILQSLVEVYKKELTIEELHSAARLALKRFIIHPHLELNSNSTYKIKALQLSINASEVLESVMNGEMKIVPKALVESIVALGRESDVKVLLTTSGLRYFVSEVMKMYHAPMTVISYDEIPMEVETEVVQDIEYENEERLAA